MKHLHVLALPCLIEHYAASPVYGDETTTDISLNGHTLSDSGNEDSELQKLGTIICPMPE